MKPFLIDIEKVEGAASFGTHIGINAAMTVREDPDPLEGVHQSKLQISIKQALVLHAYLTHALTDMGALKR